MEVGEARARVIETPGHTLGHIAYYFGDDEIVFVGDTLFSLGCGRVFEGTMDMMRLTLETLANLPGETQVYCGHEYTQANAKFALTVDPENSVLRERAQTRSRSCARTGNSPCRRRSRSKTPPTRSCGSRTRA